MDTQKLQSLLQELHGAVIRNERETSKKKLKEIEDLVEPSNFSTEDQRLGISYLLTDERSLIKLTRLFPSGERDLKARILQILLKYFKIEGSHSYIGPYIPDVANFSFQLARTEKVAQLQALALELLNAAITVSSEIPAEDWVSSLQLKTVMESLFVTSGNSVKSVLQWIYTLMGTIAFHYNDFVTNFQYSNKIADHLSKVLYHQMVVTFDRIPDKTEYPVVLGCLQGLTALMHVFTQSREDSEDNSKRIFESVKRLVYHGINFPKREACRAALKLLSLHSLQFAPLLLHSYTTTFAPALKKWCSSKNEDDKRAGQEAFRSVITTLAYTLSETNVAKDETIKIDIWKAMLMDVVDKLRSFEEEETAVEILGSLVPVLRKRACAREVQELVNFLLDKAQRLVTKNETVSGRGYLLHAYIHTIGLLLPLSEMITPDNLKLLEQLAVQLIEKYPEVYGKKKNFLPQALVCLLLGLHKKNFPLETILPDIIYQGLIRTVSHPVLMELELVKESRDMATLNDISKIYSYKDYLSLWNGLLSFSSSVDLDFMNLTLNDVVCLRNQLLAQVLQNSLQILETLNLSTRKEELEGDTQPSADPLFGYKADNPKDHAILVNLVDFLTELLATINLEDEWTHWAYTLGRKVMEYSYRYPKVSPLYRWSALILKLCTDSDYFANETSPEVGQAQKVFPQYADYVLKQLPQFRDELLASALKVLLNLPPALARTVLPHSAPALQVALKLGLSLTPMGNAVLDALETWSNKVEPAITIPLLEVVLPSLEPYLRTSGEKNARPVRAIRDETDASFALLQERVALFLGKLGPDLPVKALLTKQAGQLSAQHAVAWSWSANKTLTYDIPFRDIKPTISLDELLPVVVEIATTFGERGTKVAACELLHVSVVYLVGKVSQLTHEVRNRQGFAILYTHLIPAVITLASDVDVVIKRLFEPLLFQLVHFHARPTFQALESVGGHAKKRVVLSPETQAVLGTLLDGLCHPEDISVRTVSAQALNEFLRWTLKHVQDQDLHSGQAAPKELFKKLFGFMRHSSPYKRLGASLAFNAIYRTFRESESLVDIFALEFLFHLVECLALSDEDKEDIGTGQQAQDALTHLTRVLNYKAEVFLEVNANRRLPPVFERGTLDEVVVWLWQQCGRPETLCRQQCMALFYELCTKLPNVHSPSNFAHDFVKKHGVQALVELAEGKRLNGNVGFHMYSFRAVLECYAWLFEFHMSAPEEVLCSGSHVHTSIQHFLDNVVLANESGKDRCFAIVRLLHFMYHALSLAKGSQVFGLTFWTSPKLAEMLMLCALQPERLGFDVLVAETHQSLSEEVSKTLKAIIANYPSKMKAEFLTNFFSAVRQNELSFSLHSGYNLKLGFNYQQIINGYTILVTVDLLRFDPDWKITGSELVESIIKDFQDERIALRPAKLAVMAQLFRLALKLDFDVNMLCKLLLNRDVKGSMMTVGEFMHLRFKPVICEYLRKDSKLKQFIQRLLSNNETVGREELVILIDVLNYLHKTKSRVNHEVQKLVAENLVTLQNSPHTALVVNLLNQTLTFDDQFLAQHKSQILPWLCERLPQSTLPLTTVNAMVFLAVLCGVLTPEEERTLKIGIGTVIERFPVRSREMTSTDPKRAQYLSLTETLFSAIRNSPSTIFFELAAPMIFREPGTHIAFEQFLESTQARLQNLGRQSSIQVALLTKTFELLALIPDPESMLNALRSILLPMLGYVSKESFESFMINALPPLLTALDKPLAGNTLVPKIIAWDLIGSTFRTLETSVINRGLNRVYCHYKSKDPEPEGKDFAKAMIKAANEVRNQTLSTEKEHLLQKYFCSAYNALIAMFVATQNKLNLFANFFFNVKAGPVGKIIGEVPYKFQVVDAHLRRQKKQFLNLRKRLTEDGRVPSLPSLVDIASQYLTDSSLNEDVSRFDFANSVVRPAEHKIIQETSQENDYVMLESDSLNDHECMLPLMELVYHLQSLSSGTEVQDTNKMPVWMAEIRGRLSDPTDEGNRMLKVFLLRLIFNTESVFKPYAAHFYVPIIRFLTSGHVGDDINSFVRDIVWMILAWHETAIPDAQDTTQKTVANALWEFLLRKTPYDRKDVFRANLVMLKTMLDVWKPLLSTPSQIIYQQLKSQEMREQIAGLQIWGMILVSELPVYQPPCDEDLTTLLELVCEFLHVKKRDLYEPAAEVLGLFLARPEERGKDSIDKVSAHLTMLKKDDAKDLLIPVLNRMGSRFPSIAEQYVDLLLLFLPSLLASLRIQALECLYYGISPDSVPRQFQASVFLDFFKTKNAPEHEFALKIVEKLNFKLSLEDVCLLLPHFVQLLDWLQPGENTKQNQYFAQCRSSAYSILRKQYDLHRNGTQVEDHTIVRTCVAGLMKGLRDEESSLRQAILDFWNDEGLPRLPKESDKKIASIFQQLYVEAEEDQFPQDVVQLLLESTKRSPDYGKPLFEHALGDVTFEELDIPTTRRFRHTTLTPLFAESMLNTQDLDGMSSFSGMVPGQIRATIQGQLQFTPTLSVVKESFVDLPSSSLLSMDPSPYFSPIAKRVNTTQDSMTQSFSVPFSVRFEDRAKNQQHLARWGKSQAYQRKEAVKERRFQRETQVILTRKYRKGDIPDVQIPQSDLIEPLRALAQCHGLVARMLVVKIAAALGQELQRSNISAVAQYHEAVNRAVEQVMEQSTAYHANWINTCLEILLSSPIQPRPIQPGLIAKVSHACHLEALGIQLLGTTLPSIGLTYYFGQAEGKKARFEMVTDEKSTWHSMLRLYEGWGDWDCVRAIASEHLSDKEAMKEALEKEAAGNWQEALETYEQVRNMESLDAYEGKILSQGRLKCMAELGKWKLLHEDVINSCLATAANILTEDLPRVICDAVWNTEDGSTNSLAWALRSCVRLAVDGGSRTEKRNCLAIVDCVIKTAESKQQLSWLKENFVEDLALFYLARNKKGDNEWAFESARDGVKNFQNSWNQLSPLALVARRERLHVLCQTAEIHEFLECTRTSSGVQQQAIERFLNHCRRVQPRPGDSDSVAIWDKLMVQRLLFIERLQKPEAIDVDGESSLEVMTKLKSELCMTLANTALKKKNASLAEIYLNSLEHEKDKNAGLKASWVLATCRKNMCRKPRAKWLLKSLHDLVEAKLDEEFEWEKQLAQAQVCLGLEENWSSLDLENRTTAARFLKIDKNNPVDLAHRGLDHLKKSKALMKETQDQASVHLTFGKYCQKLLVKFEKDPAVDTWANFCVESLLLAMKSESYEAQLLFPCVLQLLERFPSTHLMFATTCGAVPSYMYLPWVSQLFSRALMCSGNEEKLPETLAPVVLRLAEDYPEALRYAFELSLESRPKNFPVVPFIGKLEELLRFDKETSMFMNALTYLAQPSVIASNCVASVLELYRKQKYAQASSTYSEFANKWLNLAEPTTNSLYGQVARKFSNTFTEMFTEVFGKAGERLNGKHNINLDSIMKKMRKPHATASLLHEYSPWLASYQGNLEMPGQYQGFGKKPRSEDIVKIVRCDSNVRVMSSLRKPVVLTLLGNDAKEHKVLVKCGEDLRQDNRIEQLFGIMNSMLQAEGNTSQKPLIRTYEVVPLSKKVGIIQWLNDTVPLKDFLEKTYTADEDNRIKGLVSRHTEWVKGVEGSFSACYAHSFTKHSREQATAAYHDWVHRVPEDLLRRAILKLSRSPEGFHYLRHVFCSSHGVLSVAHWLLGIGDRHLSNFMVDIRTGECIGIDFGMAFGVGTQFLGVPELLPCRLTPQISMLIPYLGLQGPLEESMMHGLRVFRGSADVLLAAMDVFVREPSLDWLDFASKSRQPEQENTFEGVVTEAWLPHEKVKLARLKLEGIHPAEVTEREVKLNQDGFVQKAILAIVDAVWGRPDSSNSNVRHSKRSSNPSTRLRASLKNMGLTAEEQVKCLIDQATDPALLARAWRGWTAWM